MNVRNFLWVIPFTVFCLCAEYSVRAGWALIVASGLLPHIVGLIAIAIVGGGGMMVQHWPVRPKPETPQEIMTRIALQDARHAADVARRLRAANANREERA